MGGAAGLAAAAVLALTALSAAAGARAEPQHALLFQWRRLEWDFDKAPNGTARQAEYQRERLYEHAMPAGIKVHSSGRVFVSVPRWNSGVPATLNELDVRPLDGPRDVYSRAPSSPPLRAYPSWEMNAEGDAAALQSVLGFEIHGDTLWALDQGRVNNRPALPGSVKLLGIDLRSDRVTVTHVFPEEQASLSLSFLNDLVVDARRGVMYITDSAVPLPGYAEDRPLDGGLLVYDAVCGRSRRVLDSEVSTQDDPKYWVRVQGRRVNEDSRMRTGADGIALSADGATLYYCPLTSDRLYALRTEDLVDCSLGRDALNGRVSALGKKLSASDGLACSNSAWCFATLIERNGVSSWNQTGGPAGFAASHAQLLRDDDGMVWPDTLAFDHRGSALFMSNQLNNFVAGRVNFSEPAAAPNFRVWAYAVPGFPAGDETAGSYVDGVAYTNRTNATCLVPCAAAAGGGSDRGEYLARAGAVAGVTLAVTALLVAAAAVVHRRRRSAAREASLLAEPDAGEYAPPPALQ